MKNLSDLIVEEQEHIFVVSQIKKSIVKRIKESNMPGVCKISESGLAIYSVSLGSLDKMNLSAEYYCSDSQAKTVSDALNECKTGIDLVNKIKLILKDRSVILHKNRIALNPLTISILTNVLKKGY